MTWWWKLYQLLATLRLSSNMAIWRVSHLFRWFSHFKSHWKFGDFPACYVPFTSMMFHFLKSNFKWISNCYVGFSTSYRWFFPYQKACSEEISHHCYVGFSWIFMDFHGFSGIFHLLRWRSPEQNPILTTLRSPLPIATGTRCDRSQRPAAGHGGRLWLGKP